MAVGTDIHAGAGALDLNVALTAAEAGIADLEFLSGVSNPIAAKIGPSATEDEATSQAAPTVTHHRLCRLPEVVAGGYDLLQRSRSVGR